MYEICMQIGEWLKGGRSGFPSSRGSGRVCFSFIEHGWSIRHTGRAVRVVRCDMYRELSGGRSISNALSLPPSILLALCCPRGPLDFGKVHAPQTQYCTKIHSLSRRAPHKWIRGAAADARVSPRVFRNTRVYGGTDAGSVATPDRIYEIAALKLAAAAARIASRYLLHWPLHRFIFLSDDEALVATIFFI